MDAAPTGVRRGINVGLFSRYDSDSKGKKAGTVEAEEPTESTSTQPATKGPRKKDGPTPTRRQAEEARKQRVNPSLSKKEAKRRQTAENRRQRLEAMEAAHRTPEKKLLRDMIDSHTSLGEFLLPAMLLMLAMTFLSGMWQQMTLVTMIVMYAYIALVLLDIALMWRKFKKVLAERHPGTSYKGKGLLMYGANRMVQMRRLRQPAPELKRREQY